MRKLIAMAVLFVLSACGSSKKVCNNTCATAGTTQCSGNQVQTCVADADLCLAWGTAAACAADQFCDATQNKCVACNSDCTTAGAIKCSGLKTQTCTAQANGCLMLAAATACPARQSCDATAQKCQACVDGCTTAGHTQCSGDQVQTCTADAQGCLDWSAAEACSDGETCSAADNKCVDVCTTSDTSASCGTAATKFNTCCAGTQPARTGDELCHAAVQGGRDPQQVCSLGNQATCDQLHQALNFQGQCCCPAGKTCDAANGNACK